jgi:hypothetical protein
MVFPVLVALVHLHLLLEVLLLMLEVVGLVEVFQQQEVWVALAVVVMVVQTHLTVLQEQ